MTIKFEILVCNNMMFKKRTDLPPRPKPPTNEQILEDISNSALDDSVFKGKFQ